MDRDQNCLIHILLYMIKIVKTKIKQSNVHNANNIRKKTQLERKKTYTLKQRTLEKNLLRINHIKLVKEIQN